MRWFPGDYAKDTVHLTRSEHGAYRLLIDAMWSAGGKLPNDDTRLARLALCTPDEWAECRETIMAYFQIRGRFVYQRRIAREIAHYNTVSAKRKSAGKLGGQLSDGKLKGSRQANAKQMLSKCPHNQNQNQNQSPIGPSIEEGPNRTRTATLSPDMGEAPLSLAEMRARIDAEAIELNARIGISHVPRTSAEHSSDSADGALGDDGNEVWPALCGQLPVGGEAGGGPSLAPYGACVAEIGAERRRRRGAQ